MENYLQKLFIDEAKPALSWRRGGGGSAPSAPTGPSDKRTDLRFYYQYLVDYLYEEHEPDYETSWEYWDEMHTLDTLEYPTGTGNVTTVSGSFPGAGFVSMFTVLRPNTTYGSLVTDVINVRKFLGKLDLSNVTNLTRLFDHSSLYGTGSSLEDAGTIIVSEKATAYDDMFSNQTYLERVIFEGTIAGDGLNLQYSPFLDKESLMSILNCLKDFSTESGSHKVIFGSANLNKLTEEEKAIASEKGWDIQ